MSVLYGLTSTQKTTVIVSAVAAVVAASAYLAVCQVAWARLKKLEAELFADFVRDIPPEQRATF